MHGGFLTGPLDAETLESLINGQNVSQHVNKILMAVNQQKWAQFGSPCP